MAGRAHVTLRLRGRPAASARDARARSSRPRVLMDAADGGMFVPFEDAPASSCETRLRVRGVRRKLACFCARRPARVRRNVTNGGSAAPPPFWTALAARQRADMRHLDRAPPARQRPVVRRLEGDKEAEALLFEWSMVELVERYMSDERMHPRAFPARATERASPQIPVPRRSTTTTPRGAWTGWPGRGATSRAEWEWCRSSSATSRVKRRGRRRRPGCLIGPGRVSSRIGRVGSAARR